MCRVLSVSRSGYYRWRNRPESQRAIENKRLDVRIKAIFNKHKGRYGSPKITDELSDMGFPVSKTRVARRMKEMGLRSKYRRKYRTTTDSKHSHPVASSQSPGGSLDACAICRTRYETPTVLGTSPQHSKECGVHL